MAKKKKKRKRPQVERVAGTLPWESPHPKRGHIRNNLRGKLRDKKYPLAGPDIMDHRLPGSFENGKNR